jgi:hypothetical protein
MPIGPVDRHHREIVMVVAEVDPQMPILMFRPLVQYVHEAVVLQYTEDALDHHLHVNQVGEPTERDLDLH